MDEKLKLQELFEQVAPGQWEDLATSTLRGKDPATLVRETRDGLAVEPIYFESKGSIGRVSAKTGRWTASQRYDATSLAPVRAAMKADAGRGVGSAWIRRDIMGVPIQTRADLEHLVGPFIEAGGQELIMDVGGDALMPLVALQSVEGWQSARVYADPVAHLATEGELPRSAFEELFEAVRNAGDVHVGAVSGIAYHARGATAAQEIAAILATGAEVSRRAIEKENVDAWFSQVTLVTAVTSDIFESIAKMRALRHVWAKLRAGFGLEPHEARVHACTSSVSLTRLDPWGNMLRATAQCFAAAVGGADAITVLPFDWLVGIPDETGLRIAANVHNVLDEESHITATSDPALGSYALDTLSDSIARASWELFRQIESTGGILEYLQKGHFQDRIEEAWEAREVGLRHRQPTLVGLSDYAPPDRDRIQREQKSVWEPTGKTGARPEFSELSSEFGSGGPWYEYATQDVGWRCEATAAVTEAAEFEELRDRAFDHEQHSQEPILVFMANVGPLNRYTARAGFARRYLESLGISSIGEEGFEAAQQLGDAFEESDAVAAVICGHDEDYAEHAIDFAGALKAAGARVVMYAGRPSEERTAELESAGVTHFIYTGFDAVRVGLSVFDSLEIVR